VRDNIKYFFGILAIIVGLVFIWYFKTIVFFIFLSALLSLVTRPVYAFFQGKYFTNLSFSKGWSAFATVLLIWFFILGFLSYIVPVIIEEIQFLSNVDLNILLDRFEELAHSILSPLEDSFIGKIGFPMFKIQIEDFLVSVFNLNKIQSVLGSLFGFVGSTFIALFSISFITFFLLKDEWLLLESIKMVVPEMYYVGVDHMLWSINRLLRRYFIGILLQITLVSVIIMLGFLVIGLGFRHALVIGLFSGVINIIPYLGPIIGASFGFMVSIVVYLQMLNPIGFMIYGGAILLLYIIVQLVDNIVFQPFIFSTSVKAHPLEIFLIIIMSGYMAGMLGMFLAIPVYTIIRVIAKEFFSKYNLVRKLTGKLD